MCYLRIISRKIVKRKYTELSIHANIYLSNVNTGSVLHCLNYSIKVSVERCHIVRCCFISNTAFKPSTDIVY